MSGSSTLRFTIEDPRGVRRATRVDFPLSIGGAECDVQLVVGAARPLGHLGLDGDDLFVQPAAGMAQGLHLAGSAISGSRWLRDGDEILHGDARLRIEASGGGVRLVAQPGAPPPDREPVLKPPPREGELSSVGDLIEPAPFTPAIPTYGQAKPRSATSLGRLLTLSLLVLGLAAAAALLYSAETIEIVVEPTPDHLELIGGPSFTLAERHVLLSGSYTLRAQKSGYSPLEAPLEVPSQEPFHFRLEPLPGLLEVSTPGLEGAEILIDGEPAGSTPLAEPIEVAAGEHDLRVTAARHQDLAERITVEGAGALLSIVARLEPRWAPVEFSSRPTGATVRIDGRELGTTPVTLELGAGTHRLELSLAGYTRYSAAFPVVASRPLRLSTVQLERLAGRVRLASTPPGAAVTVDGEFAGETPLELAIEPERDVEIGLSRAGFTTAIRRLELEAGEQRDMTVVLEAQMGDLAITAWPPDAQLSIDGEPRGKASQTLTLSARPHRIEVRKAGYEGFEQTVTPLPDLTHAIDVRLRTLEEIETLAMPPVYSSEEGHELRLITPGRFRMGAPRREPGRKSNEVIREIQLTRRYYLATHEVSNRQFRRFRSSHLSGDISGRSLEVDSHPVVNVSWQDAAAYCNWLSEKEGLPPAYVRRDGVLVTVRPHTTGFRLPTEAEWAWAARFSAGGSSTRYPWGDALPVAEGSGNYADASAAAIVPNAVRDLSDGFATTAPVDEYPPNARGLVSLGGNAAEWTHDLYSVGGSGDVLTDPFGPESGTHHVIRGSSWRHSTVTELRLTYRDYGTGARPDVGFRIARYAE